MKDSPGLFRRIGETSRRPVRLHVDGNPIEALEGDTLLVALLANGIRLRDSEFGDGARAGFCLMGACQDCWVWTADGGRLRACSTVVTDGARIVTHGAVWPSPR
jgi:D-hydroxyproline dehydrogenase subunit gamma